jgi:hypothetical protein
MPGATESAFIALRQFNGKRAVGASGATADLYAEAVTTLFSLTSVAAGLRFSNTTFMPCFTDRSNLLWIQKFGMDAYETDIFGAGCRMRHLQNFLKRVPLTNLYEKELVYGVPMFLNKPKRLNVQLSLPRQ